MGQPKIRHLQAAIDKLQGARVESQVMDRLLDIFSPSAVRSQKQGGAQ